ncbi:MAG TPA: hypothetical protein VGE34_04535 [Candidatus Saccharimonadales bacterium]
MNDGQSAKQQIVESIKQNSNILVTVSTDPSVDELSAALGLTVMLNNLKKHTTAVVSGAVPPAITFLDPEKTFESTVDSLRDFIIALDKEKADHLRYKVEGDVVKIFITPYRTTISESDLDFSQGDYNVELVLALGVKSQEHLDKALEAHGRILHDATVATIACEGGASQLGSIDWYDAGASSISEMLVSLSEALKADKPVLDEQISTAFLTGIVAATDRFSNEKTSSKVMTMAAQLMAAGANQQLIAAKLEEAHEITSDAPVEENKDGTTDLAEDTSSKVSKKPAKKTKKESEAPKEESAADGSLAISHEKEGTIDEVARQTAEENQSEAAEKAEEALAGQLSTAAPVAASNLPTLDDIQKDIAAESSAPAPQPPAQSLAELEMPAYEPTLGGTLNATAEQAAEDKRKEEEGDRNKMILSHSAPMADNNVPSFPAPPFNAASMPEPDEPGTPLLPSSAPVSDIGAPVMPPPFPPIDPAPAPQQPTLAEIDAENRAATHSDALADVHAAFGAPPAPVSSMPSSDGGLPPLPDFTTLPPPPVPSAPMPSMGGSLPSLPPQPAQLGQTLGDLPPAPIPAPPTPADPNQFKIPGQN